MPNTLTISDTHIRFVKGGGLEHCVEMKKKWKCKRVVHIGDVMDQHALSPSFVPHPSGLGVMEEMGQSKIILREWTKAFPKVHVMIGNHDARLYRKAAATGIPSEFMIGFKELYGTPKGWRYSLEAEYDGVLYKHGTKTGGKYGYVRAATSAGQSTVIGHAHICAGVVTMATRKDQYFGMGVGCLIDRHAYAMEYAKEMVDKPILGCGVVFNDREAIFCPMKL